MSLLRRISFLLITVLACFVFIVNASFTVVEPPRDLGVEEISFQTSEGQVTVVATITTGAADTIVYTPSYYITLQINNVSIDSVAITAETFAGGIDCMNRFPCTGGCPVDQPHCRLVAGTDCGCFKYGLVNLGSFALRQGDEITVCIDPENVVSEWDEGNNELSAIYRCPIPSHTQWGLILLILAVAGFFGYVILRRRRAIISTH